jgi:hypothetical protein
MSEKAEVENKETIDHKENKEQKGNNEKKKFKKDLPPREKLEVTLETVIPDCPKKGHRLKEPSKEQYDLDVEKVNKQIEEIYASLKNYHTEIKETSNQLKGKNDQFPLRELSKVKKDERAAMNKEFTALKKESDTTKE